MNDWMRSRSQDELSCNLFYKTKHIPLGIRYAPDGLTPDAILNLTKQKMFKVIISGKDDERVKKLIDKGWHKCISF